MGLDQMAYMATIEFQSSNAYFIYPTCHNRRIIIQSHGFGLDMFFGADCQVGIEFFQLLGQDWDWDWPLFYILRTLDWFKVWISVPNAKWTNLGLSPNPSQSNEHIILKMVKFVKLFVSLCIQRPTKTDLPEKFLIQVRNTVYKINTLLYVFPKLFSLMIR